MICPECKSTSITCLKVYITHPPDAKKYKCQNCNENFVIIQSTPNNQSNNQSNIPVKLSKQPGGGGVYK